MSETQAPPSGLDERPPHWHRTEFVRFTHYKRMVGEPSPHLAMVGWMTRASGVSERAWQLGCYGATYVLPSAQQIWHQWPLADVLDQPDLFRDWLTRHWPGITTRTERRCVRTPAKMERCLLGWADWVARDLAPLLEARAGADPVAYYELVWKSVTSVPFIGRYIAVRLIEGLRRYCGVPAALHDIRSIGGWSPKKALVYLFPHHAALLLAEGKPSQQLTDDVCRDLLAETRRAVPSCDYYVLAAMLCEYREAFEDRHQYPGWTLDQEPLLYDKTAAYWREQRDLGVSNAELDAEFWGARAALFPECALGEHTGEWRGTRWPLTKTLRDHGYSWSDTLYLYGPTLAHQNWAQPTRI